MLIWFKQYKCLVLCRLYRFWGVAKGRYINVLNNNNNNNNNNIWHFIDVDEKDVSLFGPPG